MHALQAPFIYQFYSELIDGLNNKKSIQEIELWRELLLKDNSVVDEMSLGAGSRVKAKTIASIAKHGISSKKDCLMLHELVRIIQPKVSIELGTSLGIATAYLAKAKVDCNIYTFEGNESLIKKSQELFTKLKCNNIQIIPGNIDDTFSKIVEPFDKIDMAIIDANHTQEALMRYFNILKLKMNETGILVIDDIRWSVEMYKGWKKIISDQHVSISIEFLNNGLLFFNKKLQKQHYVLSI